jgi:hypothetical protein
MEFDPLRNPIRWMKKVAASPANAFTFCLFYPSIRSFLSGL